MDIELAKAHKRYQEKIAQNEKIQMEYTTNLVRYVKHKCDILDLTSLKNTMISRTEKGKHNCYLFHVPMNSIKPKWKYESWDSFVQALKRIDIGAILSSKLGLQDLRVNIIAGFTFFLNDAAFVDLHWNPAVSSEKQISVYE